MEKAVIQTLKYFTYFDYPPTAGELYLFYPKKLKKGEFSVILNKMIKQRLITVHKTPLNQFKNLKFKIKNCQRYTLGEYRIQIKNQKSKIKNNHIAIEQYSNFCKRYTISQTKLTSLKFLIYVKLISLFPQIKLVGLSGTLAMMNAKNDDDIDLFIITAKNRLFTGRFIAIILASLLRIRRIRPIRPKSYKLPVTSYKNKLCLNLFFDEGSLAVPNHKKTPFVAHEILQMKPLIIKGDVYGQFLEANSWVFRLFPNAKSVFSIKYKVSRRKNILNTKYFILDTFSTWIEHLLRDLQLKFIRSHQTSEIITDRQLWFHPDDFGKKIPTRLPFRSPAQRDEGGLTR